MPKRLTREEFIVRSIIIHGDKYDYSKVDYINNHTKVCIICPIHGEFYQKPNDHLIGKGCRKCAGSNPSNDKEFIQKALIIHGDRYDYSKVKYINCMSKVCIICKIHGEFFQTPNVHLRGVGCPQCHNSKLENELMVFLTNNNMEFEFQKKFNWLGKQSIDFYLPNYNVGIECQGKQHFGKGGWVKNDETLNKIFALDAQKKQLCVNNNVKLIYFSNLHIDYPYFAYEDKEKMLKDIKLIGN